jgi:hypothetical protein
MVQYERTLAPPSDNSSLKGKSDLSKELKELDYKDSLFDRPKRLSEVLEELVKADLWERFCQWVTSTENRLYIGWFGLIMIPTLLTAATVLLLLLSLLPQLTSMGQGNCSQGLY